MFFSKTKRREGQRVDAASPTEREAIACVIECSDLAQYAATLLDLDEWRERTGAPCFPILSRPDRKSVVRLFPTGAAQVAPFSPCTSFEEARAATPSQLAQLLLGRCRAPGSQDSACLVFEGDDAYMLGIAHALSRGKRVEAARPHELNSARGTGSRTIVASLERVASLGLDELCYQLNPRTGSQPSSAPGRAWGLLTAPSIEQLSILIAKQHLRSETSEPRARILWPHETPPDLYPSSDVDLINYHDLEPDEIVQVSSEPVPLLLFRGHGSSYCYYGGRICTGSAADDDDPSGSRCHGAARCVFMDTEPRVRTDTFSCDTIVLDSCSSANIGDAAPNGLNLVMQLLRGGAAAVIAPYRTNVMHPMCEFLMWDLLRRGMTLGQAVSVANVAFVRDLNVVEPLLLFGDPDARVFPARDEYPRLLHVRETSEQGLRFDLPKPAATVESFCADVALQPALRADESLHCLVSSSSDQPARVLTLPDFEEGRIHWLVVWLGAQPPRSAQCVITRVPPFDLAVLDVAHEVLRGCQELMGPEPEFEEEDDLETGQPSDGGEESARWALQSTLCQSEPGLVGGMSNQTFVSAEYSVVKQYEGHIRSRVADANRELLEWFSEEHDQGFLLTNHFGQRRGISPLSQRFQTDAPCPYCEGGVQLFEYRVGVCYPHHRSQFECENCGILRDVRTGMPDVTLDGPARVDRGRVTEFTLSGTHEGRTFALLHTAYKVRSPSRDPESYALFPVSPDADEALLLPGERFDLSFEVEPSEDAVPHYYRLKAYVCLNGAVGVIYRRILIA